MNISLTQHFSDFINNKVKSGKYHSASEVVRAALRLLEEHDAQKEARLDFFRREIQNGIDSGEASIWDKDSFMKQARERSGLKE